MKSSLTNHTPTTSELRRSYDELPYRNRAKPFTHISRMAAIAQLRGLVPASPVDCRVLELGCADGENLLPMALQFPESRFFGIDLSPQQIETGRAMTAAISATNVELRAADIMELGRGDLGQYDYIIAHGIYSWVPAHVQQRILEICRDHLSDTGMAYISYNTHPGWRGKQALAEIMRYHTQTIIDPGLKAKAVLKLLAMFPSPSEMPGDPAAIQWQRLRDELSNMEDPASYLVHEYLVDSNSPCYFYEFLDGLEAVGLHYVEDAFPGSVALDRLPSAAHQWITECIADRQEQQQYTDFICNVAFRRSLICRSSRPVSRQVTYDHLAALHVTATCHHEASEDGVSRFRNDPGQTFSITHPGLQQLIQSLVDVRPMSIPLAGLRKQLGEEVENEEVAAIFDNLVNSSVVELTAAPWSCTQVITERPYASRLVRHQAPEGIVTDATHRPVVIHDKLDQQLLPLLDGTRTIADLVVALRRHLEPEPPQNAAQWEKAIQDHLTGLAERGLIMSSETEATA